MVPLKPSAAVPSVRIKMLLQSLLVCLQPQRSMAEQGSAVGMIISLLGRAAVLPPPATLTPVSTDKTRDFPVGLVSLEYKCICSMSPRLQRLWLHLQTPEGLL